MNRKKIKEIVKFSINKNLRNKWFLMLNVFIFLAIVLSINFDNINKALESNNINIFSDNIRIEVIDNNGISALTDFENEFAEDEKVEVKSVTENSYTAENVDKEVIVVEIEPDEEKIILSTITSKEGVDNEIYSRILSVIAEIRSREFASKYNINEDNLQILNEDLNIERVMLTVDADNYDTKETIKTISTMIIYIISIFVFSKIANDIAQEKVSKSIEYVLTSVTEKEYLFAKILSVVLLIILQAVYTAIYYVIGNSINLLLNIDIYMESLNDYTVTSLIQGFDMEIIGYIVIVLVYGLLTLILLSIIQAAISSKTTSMSEAGNTIALLTTITIFCYLTTLILITPYTNMSPLLYIISCIPLLSNYFVPAIIIIGQATTLQIIVSLVLLVISIPVAFNICSKIFKNGVLDYNSKGKGKKAKKELTEFEIQELRFKKEKYKKFSFVVSVSLCIYIVTTVVLEIVCSSLLFPAISNYFSETDLTLILQLICGAGALSLATIFVRIFMNATDKTPKIKLNIKQKLKIIFIGIFLVMLSQVILPFLSEGIGIDYTTETLLNFEIDETSSVTMILMFTCIAGEAAIFEELFFRKTLIDFSKKFGNIFAVVFSAFIFGLIHLNWLQFMFAFCVGLIFGTIYIKTGNIKLTMLLHFLNNSFGVITLSYENNENVLFTTVIIVLVLTLIGFIITLKSIIKNIKKFKLPKINKDDLSNYKYILHEYTFWVAGIMLVLQFALNEFIL